MAQQEIPMLCSVIVINTALVYGYYGQSSYAGPFTSVLNHTSVPSMTNVTADQLQGLGAATTISFYLAGGDSRATLLLDNLVLSANLDEFVECQPGY